ncbi:MAG: alpha/beta hydrolase, partial [Candidatus Nanopelagicales bacterium]
MRPRSARPTIGLALVAVIVLAGCSAAPTPTSPTPNKPVESTTAADDVLAAFYEQPLDWRECGGAECTKVQVPLDYDDPTGARIELSLTKVPATGESIGALLVNPGGP